MLNLFNTLLFMAQPLWGDKNKEGNLVSKRNLRSVKKVNCFFMEKNLKHYHEFERIDNN